MSTMDFDRRQRRLVIGTLALVALLLVATIGGLLALTAVTSESSTQTTVATSVAGERLAEPDELVVHVATSDETSEALGDRVVEGLQTRGKSVTVVEELDDDYDQPVLIIAADHARFDRGLTTRTATIDVAFYYSTEGDVEQWQQYRAGEPLILEGPSGIVTGEITHQDRTRGLTTTERHRASVYDAIATEVLDNYRGALDQP